MASRVQAGGARGGSTPRGPTRVDARRGRRGAGCDAAAADGTSVGPQRRSLLLWFRLHWGAKPFTPSDLCEGQGRGRRGQGGARAPRPAGDEMEGGARGAAASPAAAPRRRRPRGSRARGGAGARQHEAGAQRAPRAPRRPHGVRRCVPWGWGRLKSGGRRRGAKSQTPRTHLGGARRGGRGAGRLPPSQEVPRLTPPAVLRGNRLAVLPAGGCRQAC
jgi:hypothetical protein